MIVMKIRFCDMCKSGVVMRACWFVVLCALGARLAPGRRICDISLLSFSVPFLSYFFRSEYRSQSTLAMPLAKSLSSFISITIILFFAQGLAS